jgi:hypothetical protein
VTWVKLDDHFDEHEKVVGLSEAAFRAFVEGLCYCSRNLTDGRIPAAKLKRLTRTRTAGELVDAGLWHPNGDGVRVHDYLEFQPSSATIRAKRAADSERKKSGK